MTAQIHKSWDPYLGSEFQKPYLKKLSQEIREDLEKGETLYPPINCFFRALQLTPWDSVKVVIVGQDPYHGPGEANGLAFAVNPHVRSLPPSLRNILKEVESDGGSLPSPDLLAWAQQGVLLLNRLLCVKKKRPLSYENRGWEIFTEAVIRSLNEKPHPVCFLLWGKTAQSLKNLIQSPPHCILETSHPSPLSAHRGFLGSRVFTRTNELLKSFHLAPIDWSASLSS